MFAVAGYLSDKSSDVSLWLGQILVSSRFENAGLGAKLWCSRNFFIMVNTNNKTNTSRENLMIVLLAQCQIIVDVIE